MTADSSGLGTKPVARLALTMSVPTIVAQAANASYTIIDRLFIGHIPEVGDAAMTGVGICFPILLAVTAFASLIGAGGAAVTVATVLSALILIARIAVFAVLAILAYTEYKPAAGGDKAEKKSAPQAAAEPPADATDAAHSSADAEETDSAEQAQTK